MSKLIAVILCIMLTNPILIFANDNNEKESNEFYRNRLEIQVKKTAFGTYSPTTSIATISEYSSWKFYEGFERISESKFLKTVGFEQEAEIAEKHHKVNRGLLGIALVLLGTGLVSYGVYIHYSDKTNQYDYGSDDYKKYNNKSINWMLAGISLNIASLIPLFVILGRGENWMPLNQAVEIKNNYNSNLKKQYNIE